MRRSIRRSAGAAGAVLGGALAAAAAAGALWSRGTARAVERLDVPPGGAAPPVSRADLRALPAPAARYLAWALTPGQPRVRRARIEHEGEFRGTLEAPWSPFRSVEHFAASPPGFVWDASIRMASLVPVRVRDSYLAGRGAMLGRMGGVVPVVRQEGSPEIASAALLRWLAEAVWLPTALLPGEGVRWDALDDSTARASVEDRGLSVSTEVRFAPDGSVASVAAERFRDVDGAAVLTPWEGRFSDYAEVRGMRILMRGAVAWLLPEGRLEYWRGRIVRSEYDFAP